MIVGQRPEPFQHMNSIIAAAVGDCILEDILVHSQIKKPQHSAAVFALDKRELNNVLAARSKYRTFVSAESSAAVVIYHFITERLKASLDPFLRIDLLFRFFAFSRTHVRAETHKIVPDDI